MRLVSARTWASRCDRSSPRRRRRRRATCSGEAAHALCHCSVDCGRPGDGPARCLGLFATERGGRARGTRERDLHILLDESRAGLDAAKSNPDDATSRRFLSYFYNSVGDTEVKLGRLEPALDHYSAGVVLAKRIAGYGDPELVKRQNWWNVAVSIPSSVRSIPLRTRSRRRARRSPRRVR